MAHVMRSQLTTAGGAESRISCAEGNRTEAAVPPAVGGRGGDPCGARGGTRGGIGDGETTGAGDRRSPDAGGCAATSTIAIRPTTGALVIQEASTQIGFMTSTRFPRPGPRRALMAVR
jgi:hypothetical protein